MTSTKSFFNSCITTEDPQSSKHARRLKTDLWLSTAQRGKNQSLVTFAQPKTLLQFSFTHPLHHYLHGQKGTTLSWPPYGWRTSTAYSQDFNISYAPHSSISSSWTASFIVPVSSALEGLSVLSECGGTDIYTLNHKACLWEDEKTKPVMLYLVWNCTKRHNSSWRKKSLTE